MPLRAFLIPAYAVATLFPRLLGLPGWAARVQLTEVIFLLALWSFRREWMGEVRKYPLFALALAGYLAVNLLSAWYGGDAGAMLEAGARVYLGVLVFLVSAHVTAYGNSRVTGWWKWGSAVVAGGCLLVYGWVLLGGEDPAYFVARIPEYPYLGTVYRLRGTANVYGMLYMLLLPGLFIAYLDWREGNARWWPVALIAVAGLLTYGKENLLFPVGLLLYESSRRVVPSLPGYASAIVLSIVLLFGTHYLVQRTGHELSERGYTSRTAFTAGVYQFDETNYTANKRAAWLIGSRHPGLGVGPGRYSQHTAALVATGEYPAHFGRFDPHCAWTGAFAETGLPGLLSLLLVAASLLYYRPARLEIFGLLLLLFLLASVFKDVMNFRGLWLLVGLYLVRWDIACKMTGRR